MMACESIRKRECDHTVLRTASIIRAVIILMMQAVRTSETSVYYKETQRSNIPEGSNLHTRRRVNLKSHVKSYVLSEVRTKFLYIF
jgi:hypothetical protein